MLITQIMAAILFRLFGKMFVARLRMWHRSLWPHRSNIIIGLLLLAVLILMLPDLIGQGDEPDTDENSLSELSLSELGLNVDVEDDVAPQKLFDSGPEKLRLLVLILSPLDSSRQREMLRQSWLTCSYLDADVFDLRWRFIVSIEANTPVHSKIIEENKKYGDIARVHVKDDYRHNTAKLGALLRWAKNRASNADFVVKADMDAFVNLQLLGDHIRKRTAEISADLREGKVHYYGGKLWSDLEPVRSNEDVLYRNINLKWKVTYEDWPLETYPPYMQGSLNVFSARLAFQIGSAFQDPCSFLPSAGINDVATGIMIWHLQRHNRINVIFDDIPNTFADFGINTWFNKIDLTAEVILIHKMNPELMPLFFNYTVIMKNPIRRCPACHPPLDLIKLLPFGDLVSGSLFLAPLPGSHLQENGCASRTYTENLLSRPVQRWHTFGICWKTVPEPEENKAKGRKQEVEETDAHCCPDSCYVDDPTNNPKIRNGHINKWFLDNFSREAKTAAADQRKA